MKGSHVKAVAWLGVASCVLLACILQSELLLPPHWLERPGRILYRVAFFIIIPFRVPMAAVFPRVGHHWTMAHYVVSSLGTPFFLWGCWALWRRVRRKPPVPQQASRTPVGRRRFLLRTAAGAAAAAAAAAAGCGAYASIIEPGCIKLRTYEVPIDGLPAELDGIRLAHVSDTHYGPYTALSFLEGVAGRVSALDTDYVVMTGDYVHFTPRSIERGIGLLAKFKSRLGSVAVMGNHEHWEGAGACRREFERIGLPLVDNARLFLTPDGLRGEPIPGKSLCLAGVGDYHEDMVSFEKALDGVPEAMPRIVLSHNPDTAELIRTGQRVDLMLCGHTHGGQVSLPGIGAPWTGSQYGSKYLGGMCRGPHCPVLVSRGVGIALLPLRFRVPPEVGLVTLRRARPA